MKIDVYGKQGCGLCKSAIKKVEVLQKKGELPSEVPVRFMDMETEHGAAEGDFFDVFDVPTVLLMCSEGKVVARWDGKAPNTDELRTHLEAA